MIWKIVGLVSKGCNLIGSDGNKEAFNYFPFFHGLQGCIHLLRQTLGGGVSDFWQPIQNILFPIQKFWQGGRGGPKSRKKLWRNKWMQPKRRKPLKTSNRWQGNKSTIESNEIFKLKIVWQGTKWLDHLSFLFIFLWAYTLVFSHSISC